MNLHLPQDDEAECELRFLAAVPYQIISPANNKSIVGIFQDSLLGSYQFTREDVAFDQRTAMNLLMYMKKLDLSRIDFSKSKITNFDILTQIFPEMSIKYRTKQFRDGEDPATSNNVFEVDNGQYLRGQMDKGVLGDGGKGLLQRIYNDYDTQTCSQFVDDLQNIITEYMKKSS
jgi:DNA-directed RNA polymerase II subunit RPB1